MRWDSLFDDLEAVMAATERAVFDAEVSDLARAERAALRIGDRLRGHLGQPVRCQTVSGDRLSGRLVEVGADWFVLDDGAPLVVALGAVRAFDGLSRSAAVDARALADRYTLPIMLRAIARDRSAVRLRLVTTGAMAGAAVTGTIDRVAADHLDLAVHPDDEPRRAGSIRSVWTVPLTALISVRVLTGDHPR